MKVKNLDMKLIVAQINRVIRNCFFKLIISDFLLIFLYYYFQPLCEPCIDLHNCPLCMSKEQYVIVYLGIALNLMLGVYCLLKKKRYI